MTTSQSQTLPSPVRRWNRRHPVALLLIWLLHRRPGVGFRAGSLFLVGLMHRPFVSRH